MSYFNSVQQGSFRVNGRQVKGILCTITAAVIWVLASFVVQKVEDQGLSPFILSYIANSLFVVFLPLDYVLQKEICNPARYQRYVSGPFESFSLHTRPAVTVRTADRERPFASFKKFWDDATLSRLQEESQEQAQVQGEPYSGQLTNKHTNKLLLGYFQEDLLKAALVVRNLTGSLRTSH